MLRDPPLAISYSDLSTWCRKDPFRQPCTVPLKIWSAPSLLMILSLSLSLFTKSGEFGCWRMRELLKDEWRGTNYWDSTLTIRQYIS